MNFATALTRRSLPFGCGQRRTIYSALRYSDPNRFKVRNNFQVQQLRFRRHDRASAFNKPRPRTKKQRQAYNRKIKRIEDEKAKHSAPGAKAGPRRQFIRERWQQLLDHGGDESKDLTIQEEPEYGMEDALMEDILGNTAHLTSQPTPEPVYLGHMHKKYYNVVADQMEAYRRAIDLQAANGEADGKDVVDVAALKAQLPSDDSISKVLRAYRDRHGTRNRPIGIVMALQHCINDLGVPIIAFGEMTFTSLLTCCRTPNEARRIFKLMNDNKHPVSAYSWSILVDIHAKMGDFEGCANVIKEMAREGMPPTQAAYTSLLAACYKVCNDGRIPHSIRAKAGEIGWQNWQEMRIVGIDADAMAYGAIIRLCAARGQAERAINLLEEMNRFDVKPTTLCFSGALKAVARSHEIGVRFERGSSRKQLRRELFAAHHGKMAREILILAENAEVEQDDGFVSALMLCAAAAGDSATAKAVYLAAEIRKMDFLRTIGSEEQLRQLRGGGDTLSIEAENRMSLAEHERSSSISGLRDDNEIESTQSASDVLARQSHIDSRALQTFGEREYGKDTRTLSALLRASAQAVNSNGIGTIWEGRENQGYLCENSLRLITTRREPSYSKTSIPSELSTKFGTSSLRRFDENKNDDDPTKTRTRKKFRGLYLDDDTEDIIDDYTGQYLEDGNDDAVEFLDYKQPNNESKTKTRDQAEVDKNFESVQTSSDDEAEEVAGSAESEEGFDLFYEELQVEAIKNGFDEGISKEEAQKLFEMMQDEFELNDNFLGDIDETVTDDSLDLSQSISSSDDDSVLSVLEEYEGLPIEGIVPVPQGAQEIEDLDEESYNKILVLQEALPGLPVTRLKRILNAFSSTLSYPSTLSLVPILRESMPDHLSSGWLKRVNMANAEFVLQRAEANNIVNGPLLNGMLEVKASAGSLDAAERFHAEKYKEHRMTPSQYSDRLVLQMLVANKRMQRAHAFKHKVEQQKRSLDIPSYGSMIDHYARHDQLGSALMLLKECIDVHGSPPGEKFLTSTRIAYKQLELGTEEDLTALIGKDPTEWLRYGEKNLKRERSKKGRRNVQLAYNRILG